MFDTTAMFSLGEDASCSGLPDVSARNPCDKDLQRAEGSGRIVLGGSENGTRIMDVFQRSPIRIMFPNIRWSPVEEAVLVNTAGGIAGGDRARICCDGASQCFHRGDVTSGRKGLSGVERARAHHHKAESVSRSRRLAWLPQETIVFNWGPLNRETEIELSSGAELLALEWLVLGRAAHGEEMVGGHISDSWRVKKDGRLIWADSFRVTDETFPHLRRKALLANCKAVGR